MALSTLVWLKSEEWSQLALHDSEGLFQPYNSMKHIISLGATTSVWVWLSPLSQLGHRGHHRAGGDMAQAAGSPGGGGSQLWAPGASAACSGTVRRAELSRTCVCGQPAGKCSAEPFILPVGREGDCKGPPQPCQWLRKGISGFGMEIVHPHLHTLQQRDEFATSQQ